MTLVMDLSVQLVRVRFPCAPNNELVPSIAPPKSRIWTREARFVLIQSAKTASAVPKVILKSWRVFRYVVDELIVTKNCMVCIVR